MMKGGIGNMMKQAQALQANMQKAQAEIAAMSESLEGLLQRPIDAPLRFESVMDAVDGASAAWWRTAAAKPIRSISSMSGWA